MQPKLIPLETLLRWLWEDNPKLHQDVLIQHSIVEYGFNDRVGVCSKFMLILEGHGRLGSLKRLKDLVSQGDASAKIPLNIQPDPVLGDWLIPCDDHDQFATKEQAYQYALLHNRAGTTGLDLRDYDVAKLQKAINKASAGQQMGFELVGFGTDDFAQGSTSLGTTPAVAQPAQPVTGVVQLPKTAVFDPSNLSDAPTYQPNQAPQSYVAMVTAPDFASFIKVLSALTFGERKSLPEGSRFASVDGMKFLPEWERLLVAKETLVVTPFAQQSAPLPGQITLAGDIVGDKGVVSQAVALMEGAETEQSNAPSSAMYHAPTEPTWDSDGNCPICNGKGYAGTRVIAGSSYKVYCTSCNASGTKSIWDEGRAQ